MGPLQFDWPWSATDLMKCYKDSGKGDESYPYFLRISELYPQNWGIWHALGVSKFTVLDEPEDAIKYYQKATQKRSNKGWVWSWFDMGLCFVKINKIDEAQNCFKKALENKPDCWEAYNQLARGAISLKRWGEVLDFIQKGLEIKQDEPELWLAAGDFFLGNHHPNSFFAWKAIRMALSLHKNNSSTYLRNLASTRLMHWVKNSIPINIRRLAWWNQKKNQIKF